MPSKVIVGLGIGAVALALSGLGASVRAPGKTCFVPRGGDSSSRGRMKLFLWASVIVLGRTLTSPRNSDGTTLGPMLAIPATRASFFGAAKLSIAREVPGKQN